MQNQKPLVSIINLLMKVLLNGSGLTGIKFNEYIKFLLSGIELKVSYHDIKYTDLSRQVRDLLSDLFDVTMVKGVIQTMKLKLNKIPKNKRISESMLIEAVLEANPDFKRVMHQLMQWMSSCTVEIRQKLSALLVTVMCRSSEENVAFGYLDNREFVLDNMDSLFEIFPGLYYNDDFMWSLQVGDRFKTFGVVKENEQLFKYVFAEAVRNMPDPKPEDEGSRRSHEFKADSLLLLRLR